MRGTRSNYTFQINVYNSAQFQIQVVIPSGDFATLEGADSEIDSEGLTPVFTVPALSPTAAPPAGIASMNVTTTQDDANVAIPDKVTLRDAIKTGINTSRPQVTFTQDVTGTISLQAALPNLSKNVTIARPGASTLTVQGNGNAGNP